VESWSPGGVHLESVGEGKLHHKREEQEADKKEV
jgi:hypothetical protein